MNTNYKLRDVERFTRFILGFGIVLSILVIPLTSAGIAAACALAVYPLVTSLVALDPVFYVLHQLTKQTDIDLSGKVKTA